jgi:hypothetical protein
MGNNSNYTFSSSVNYCCGGQPKNSAGGNFGSPLSAGVTPTSTCILTGIHPWFWGKSPTAPVVSQALINSIATDGGKCVGLSTGTIRVDNFNTTGAYIWFAIPSTSPTKT